MPTKCEVRVVRNQLDALESCGWMWLVHLKVNLFTWQSGYTFGKLTSPQMVVYVGNDPPTTQFQAGERIHPDTCSLVFSLLDVGYDLRVLAMPLCQGPNAFYRMSVCSVWVNSGYWGVQPT